MQQSGILLTQMRIVNVPDVSVFDVQTFHVQILIYPRRAATPNRPGAR